MSKKIQIICTKPGMRRNGIEHPQSAIYEPGRWTESELTAFRSDPSFIIQEIEGDGSLTRGPEFDLAVEEAVTKLLDERVAQMQASFAQAVQDAAAEKVREKAEQLQSEHKAELAALKAENADLQTKLEAATKPSGKPAK